MRILLIIIGLVIALCGCRYERLPAYWVARSHQAGNQHLFRMGGAYFNGGYGTEWNPQYPGLVTFFYSDGRCLSSGRNLYTGIDEHILNMQKMMSSERGRYLDWKYGTGWGIYLLSGDTLMIQDYRDVNGSRKAYATKYLITSDTTLVLLELKKLSNGRNEHLPSMREYRQFSFTPTLWKPDSSLFFDGNKRFMRVQSRRRP